MLIDVIALGLLILSIFKGFKKGLIIAVFSFLAFLIGLAAALKLSATVATYIGNSINVGQRWLPVLAFLVVFFLVVLLVRLGAKLLEGIMQIAMLGWLNKLGGTAFYLLIYFFIFSIILFYAQQLHLLKTEPESISYRYIQPLGPAIINMMGLVIPFFKNMFDQLLLFFQHISEKDHTAYSFYVNRLMCLG